MKTHNGSIGRSALYALLAAGATALSGSASADETLFCNQYILSLPYRVTAPGHYCLARNLSTPANPAYTVAITIDADSVVLDLNQFTLDGSAVGSATAMTGILGLADHRRITVRNGVVRGFFDGINLYGAGGGHTVEHLWADHNYESGIGIRSLGGRNLVRDNVVTDTGGSTNLNEFPGGVANAFGISVNGSANVINNEVTHTFGMNGGIAWAFELVFEGEGQIAVNNRVIGADTLGFACGAGPTPMVVLRDNVVLGAATPYGAGCTKIGTTNFP